MARVATIVGFTLALLIQTVPHASGADRWEEGGHGAVAILPRPRPAAGLAGGSLYCSEQRWSLMLRLAEESPLAEAGHQKALIMAADTTMELDSRIEGDSLIVGVPGELLTALKQANSLTLEFAARGGSKSVFTLANSKSVIEAVAPRCSQIDMSAFRQIKLLPDQATAASVKALLSEEMKLFREFAGTEPAVSSALMDAGAGRQLMFASLCGSKRYFGESGCSLTGYAREGEGQDWRRVYESEGMLLYTDPTTDSEGWPSLVTLPMTGGTKPMHWRWSADHFELAEDVASEAAHSSWEEGDAAQ